MGMMEAAGGIAEAMVFLAPDRAKFVIAVTLPVDGGHCAWALLAMLSRSMMTIMLETS